MIYHSGLVLLTIVGLQQRSENMTSGKLMPVFAKKILVWHLNVYACKMGFCGDSDGKESAYNVGDPGSIPGSGRYPRGGNDNSLQLVWKIPWTEEPGRLQSMGSQTGRQD